MISIFLFFSYMMLYKPQEWYHVIHISLALFGITSLHDGDHDGTDWCRPFHIYMFIGYIGTVWVIFSESTVYIVYKVARKEHMRIFFVPVSYKIAKSL